MKQITFTMLIVLNMISSCQNNSSQPKNTHNEQEIENSKIEDMKSYLKDLLDKLLSFKDTPEFKEYGFGQVGPYYDWLYDIQQLKEHPDAKLLLKRRIVVGELEQLGLAYASSGGKETDVTTQLKKLLLNALSSEYEEPIETSSGNENYDKLKVDYQLFGKWTIKNSVVKQSYPYEIYQRGDDYIGVIPVEDFRTEILEKKGNKFVIKGSRFGEYYMISDNKEMTLFDENGDLKRSGYEAIKE